MTALVDPVPARPGRAELRRQREGGNGDVAAPTSRPSSAATASRLERRRAAEQHRRAARRDRALWKAWWLYPLVTVAAVCVVLGVRSASTPVPDGPQWVVTSTSASPAPTAAATGG